MGRLTQRTDELYASLEKKPDNDNAQMTVCMLLFWPEAAEYQHLKGEQNTLAKIAGCNTGVSILCPTSRLSPVDGTILIANALPCLYYQ